MAIKTDEVTFSTTRTVQDLGRALQDAFAAIGAGSVDEIEHGSGALSQFDDRDDIEVVAQGATFTSLWAVQVYVRDLGAERNVKVIALGESGLARAWGGTRNTASLSICRVTR